MTCTSSFNSAHATAARMSAGIVLLIAFNFSGLLSRSRAIRGSASSWPATTVLKAGTSCSRSQEKIRRSFVLWPGSNAGRTVVWGRCFLECHCKDILGGCFPCIQRRKLFDGKLNQCSRLWLKWLTDQRRRQAGVRFALALRPFWLIRSKQLFTFDILTNFHAATFAVYGSGAPRGGLTASDRYRG